MKHANIGGSAVILGLVLGLFFPVWRLVWQTPIAAAAQLTATPTPPPAGPRHAGPSDAPAPSQPEIVVGPLHDDIPLPQSGRIQVIIILSDIPAASAYAALRAMPGISDTAAQRLAQEYAARQDAAQQALVPTLTGPAINAVVIGRTQNVLNSIMVEVDAEKISLIQTLSGVVAVRLLGVGTFDAPTFPGGPIQPSAVNHSDDGTFPGQPIQGMTE